MTETDFNRKITTAFKRLGTSHYALKTADRVKIGLPDWIWFSEGKAIAVEAKYTKKHSPRGVLLGHPLGAEQRTSLEVFARTGVPGWVVIGVEDTSEITAICFTRLLRELKETCTSFPTIPAEHMLYRISPLLIRGNISTPAFRGTRFGTKWVKTFDKKSTGDMIEHILEISLHSYDSPVIIL